MKLTVEVIGLKAFKGSVDGKAIDSATLYARVKMDGRRNEIGSDKISFKAGEAVEEWKLPNAEMALRFKDAKLPCVVSLEVERLSNGSETRDVVTDAVLHAAVEPIRKAA